MKPFGKIEQFRSIVRRVREVHDYKGSDEQGNPVYEHTEPYHRLGFTGTVKVHGSNGCVVYYPENKEIRYQSRSREIQVGNDNMGFAAAQSQNDWMRWFKLLHEQAKAFVYEPIESIAVYGEWAGKGIQKGVGVSELDRMFIVFDVRINDISIDPLVRRIFNAEERIYNIHNFKTFYIHVDFNNPEDALNKIVEQTLEVEAQCPVAAALGVKGIGEGVVYSTKFGENVLRFKSKGEKHSVTKVKKLVSVDPEILKSQTEFVQYACTENRLSQGLEHVSLDVKNIGDFIKWVAKDILAEESDTLEASGLEWKQVAPMINRKAVEFFKSKI